CRFWRTSRAMPGIDFAELRRQIRLGQILELVRFEVVSRRGAQVRGPCPVHGSTRPRSRVFAAHLGEQMWHCLPLGAQGNGLGWGARGSGWAWGWGVPRKRV